MSVKETNNAFQNSRSKITEQEIAKIIGGTLRDCFPEAKAAIRKISRETGADSRSVWNWYNGLNTPSCLNLIMLAQKFPAVVQSILFLCNRLDIWDSHQKQQLLSELDLKKYESAERNEFYSDIFVGIDLRHGIKLNQRQLWFVKRLQLGFEVKAADIIQFWNISDRTAQRDISEMLDCGLIRFAGAKKNGSYKIQLKP